MVLLIGEMNAQINGDYKDSGCVIGPYGSGSRLTDNGERMQLLCGMNSLCIGNTYFPHKNIHKKTWHSPDGCTLNEIDFVCISRKWRTALMDVRAQRGADIGSDHYLVRAKI